MFLQATNQMDTPTAILISLLFFMGLVAVGYIIYVLIMVIKNEKVRKRLEKEANEKYLEDIKNANKCIDLILEGNSSEAKKVYNQIDENNKVRWFLNGVLIGLDVETNRERLLENKYDIDKLTKELEL